MKSLIAAFAFFMASLAVASAGFDATKDARRAIASQYKLITRGFEKGDLKPMENALADDYEARLPGNRLAHKSDVLSEFGKQAAELKNIHWNRRIIAFKLTGAGALATIDGTLKGTTIAADKKAHRLEIRATSTDDWVKVGGDWKIKTNKVLAFKVKVDGKAAQLR